jgi:hypothetical protein
MTALGICLEDYEYPYPVQFLSLTNDLQPVSMAYGDVRPVAEPNGRTVVLMHGKAFGGSVRRDALPARTALDRSGSHPQLRQGVLRDPRSEGVGTAG